MNVTGITIWWDRVDCLECNGHIDSYQCGDSETPIAVSMTREWYLPDARPVTSANPPFIKSQVSSAVSL